MQDGIKGSLGEEAGRERKEAAPGNATKATLGLSRTFHLVH